jgi:hypothetical protein
MQMIKKLFLLSFMFISVCNAANRITTIVSSYTLVSINNLKLLNMHLYDLVKAEDYNCTTLPEIRGLVQLGARTDIGIGDQKFTKLPTVDGLVRRFEKRGDNIATLRAALYGGDEAR